MTLIHQQQRPVAEPIDVLVNRAASVSDRLVQSWGDLDDDDRFELTQLLSRCLQEIRRRTEH